MNNNNNNNSFNQNTSNNTVNLNKNYPSQPVGGNQSGFNQNQNYSSQPVNENQYGSYSSQPVDGNQSGSFNSNDSQYNNGYNYGSSAPNNFNGNSNNYYGNQPTNNNGSDPNSTKAVVSMVTGIISLALAVIGIIVFWGSMASACNAAADLRILSADTTAGIGMGIIISGILPVIALISGIIGIVLGVGYKKKAQQTGILTNQSKATMGVVMSIIGVILSALSIISCVSCLGCASCSAGQGPDYDLYGDFSNSIIEHNDYY